MGWLLIGGAGRTVAPLDDLQARLDKTPAGHAPAAASSGAALSAAISPSLFAADGADVPVRLDGLSRTARRSAALVSINNGPSQWLAQGATREGVTLVQVQSTKVVIDSRAGRRVVTLGETSGGSPDPAVGAASDQPPPGARMPPPPASAPGAP